MNDGFHTATDSGHFYKATPIVCVFIKQHHHLIKTSYEPFTRECRDSRKEEKSAPLPNKNSRLSPRNELYADRFGQLYQIERTIRGDIHRVYLPQHEGERPVRHTNRGHATKSDTKVNTGKPKHTNATESQITRGTTSTRRSAAASKAAPSKAEADARKLRRKQLHENCPVGAISILLAGI